MRQLLPATPPSALTTVRAKGWSDPPPSPQGGVAVAIDLHTLLDRAQIPGPYVVVGHSTGGAYARIFAARYPDQVAGMVMLDSQPNEAFTGLPDFPSFYTHDPPSVSTLPITGALRSVSTGQSVHFGSSAGPDS